MRSELLKILIVEDEFLIAEMLQELLAELGYEVVSKVKNFATALAALETTPEINFVFVDINLSESKTGFDVAQKIVESYHIPLIFLTSYSDSETIQAAMTYKPEAYLIKPFTKSDLFVTLEVFKSRQFTNTGFYELKDGHFNAKIKYSDILWIKSDNNYIEIKTLSKTYVIRSSLEKFLESNKHKDFFRIHRSYVVNIQHIKAISRIHIIVQDQKLPISRMHHDELVQRFSKK